MLSVVIILLILVTHLLFFNNKDSAEYLEVLAKIDLGNKYLSENGVSDDCFPYRYFHKGCYYEGKLKFYNGLLVGSFLDSNLTKTERVRLCYVFLFNGSTVYCLQQNNELRKCYEFAGKDEYLARICGLKEGETIPTEGFWDSEYKDNPIPTRWLIPD